MLVWYGILEFNVPLGYMLVCYVLVIYMNYCVISCYILLYHIALFKFVYIVVFADEIVYFRNCKGWPALMGVSLLWQPATVPLRMHLYCHFTWQIKFLLLLRSIRINKYCLYFTKVINI